MSLVEYDLMGNKRDKVQIAIDRLRAFEPEDGYYLAFSGGKDSQCIYHLAKRAGVKFDAHYHVTSVDPPELVQFIKRQYPDVSIDIPHDKDGNRLSMWNLIVKKLIPPTRLIRYCCAYLKEPGGKGRVTLTGVRWAESANRKNKQGVVTIIGTHARRVAEDNGAQYKANTAHGMVLNMDNDPARRTVEQCYRTHKTVVNVIVDWDDDDVWEYLDMVEKVPHCCLYDQGYARLGCIGCPMASNAAEELERYPKIKQAYMRTFARMINERKRRGVAVDRYFTTPETVMDWWLGKTQKKQLDGQMQIEDLMEQEG